MSGRAVRVLVTGSNGQLGVELTASLRTRYDVTAATRRELDLARPDQIRSAVRAIRPDVIINAGAYTSVDRAESDAALCAAVNARAPGILAEEAARAGALLIHFSTDYVFDGARSAPYTELDEPNPLNVYGRTKLEGERSIAAVGTPFFVLRTSWVYGHSGQNFVRRVLALAREREQLRVVSDQIGAPTWSRDLAEATTRLVDRSSSDDAGGWAAAASGVYHLTSAGQGSWYDLAAAALTLDPRREEHRCRELVAVSTTEFPTAARRPANSLLDCTRATTLLGRRPGEWRARLAAAFAAGPITPAKISSC